MAKKKRISTLWFTLPVLGFLYPPLGLVLLVFVAVFALFCFANMIEILVQDARERRARRA